jgi:hypothetical protein
LGGVAGFSVQKENRLPVGTIQFDEEKLPNRSWIRIEQSAIQGNGKGCFVDGLKIRRILNEGGWVETIDEDGCFERWFSGRNAREKKKDERE